MDDANFEAAPELDTPAEALGMPHELGRAIARLAAQEAVAGRTDVALAILEGLVVTNPHDPAAWALLAGVHKRRGRLHAARLCASVAHRLAPDDRQVRLARAEALLASADDRAEARSELEALSADPDAVGARSRALLTALGAWPGRGGARAEPPVLT